MSYHSNIPEADAELIATNASENFEKDGPLLVVSSGGDTISVASSIKRLASDHVFTMQIQHPQSHLSRFDLVISPRHDYYPQTPEGKKHIPWFLRGWIPLVNLLEKMWWRGAHGNLRTSRNVYKKEEWFDRSLRGAHGNLRTSRNVYKKEEWFDRSLMTETWIYPRPQDTMEAAAEHVIQALGKRGWRLHP
ncbi:Mitochondrial fission ELM1-like protein [Artemisia annua]|uniref:Mitochondrial fission ELM1-like protein n=1 Tax=Artemisia annua TaxID=35608 RepID=A0A2U1KTQ4_ARTAN|nr:Mitochondrial fission ELM1-like protein [Artemisia annua]